MMGMGMVMDAHPIEMFQFLHPLSIRQIKKWGFSSSSVIVTSKEFKDQGQEETMYGQTFQVCKISLLSGI